MQWHYYSFPWLMHTNITILLRVAKQLKKETVGFCFWRVKHCLNTLIYYLIYILYFYVYTLKLLFYRFQLFQSLQQDKIKTRRCKILYACQLCQTDMPFLPTTKLFLWITCKNKTKIYLFSFVLLDMQSLRSSCGLKSAYTGPDEKFCVFTPSSKTIKWGSCHHRIEVYAQSLTQWNNKINP